MVQQQPEWNGDEDNPIWGDKDAPFIGFKIARVGLAKKIKNGQQLEPYQPEIVQHQLKKPESISLAQFDQIMGDEYKTLTSIDLQL